MNKPLLRFFVQWRRGAGANERRPTEDFAAGRLFEIREG